MWFHLHPTDTFNKKNDPTQNNPAELTFKVIMCDQPERHHKGKFLKVEKTYRFIIHNSSESKDLQFQLSYITSLETRCTCGLSSRLTLAGAGGRGGKVEGGLLETTCSTPPCGFTV